MTIHVGNNARYDRLHAALGPGSFNYSGDWNSPRVPAAGYTGLSLATGISRVHISRVLRGLVGVSLDVLTKISTATGVGLEDLSWYIEQNKCRHKDKDERQTKRRR